MPRILDRMPFPQDPTETVFRDERVRLRGDQIVLWATLGHERVSSPNPLAVPFPVILDTGHTHSFAIRDRHLTDWAGIDPAALPIVGAVRDRGQRLLLRTARIWAHPNRPRSRDLLADRPPIQLAAPAGIAIYPTAGGFPRLPILGLRAIADNKLVLKVNGRTREATLRTAYRWWPFF